MLMIPRIWLTTLPWASCALAIPLFPFPFDIETLWTLFGGNNIPQQRIFDTAGWYDPRIGGGQMLDYTLENFGEPLNVIISGNSDPHILTEDGIHQYAKSIGFSEECLGLHYGNRHDANLGDGDGRKVEQFLARQAYFPIIGTCWESVAGGHHFRAWKQNGSMADSGAWFIGASKEYDYQRHHGIVPNGYNLGRDFVVKRATSGGSWKGKYWKAEVEWRTDLLEEGSEGVNHGIEQDGRVAVLTVHRLV
ncbi:hypothetical protein AGABI1DRAFT_114058 [Agaricus bisporus var. burnettii JB137-S8]|uniref:Uncharacterized protein n=1 Tax=Agaricus bisporus var. burnettii (strain JB137-S8 / ATCC MYA-4627 / FGSC 10392) TaxID=597362 RepID=K5WVK4_AGABU|nr:uncharacterized protein AGABI1DRAFT_114058 [Agaricus bisporus var. burnettii JB137-S8]EKM79511.1 hypothetical protein AGABI1DRAFT_114058 [Agaricus bisporus var. burnettii JB137-S8]